MEVQNQDQYKTQYHQIANLGTITKQDRDDAFGSYLMMFVFVVVGFPFPFINFIAALIYCIAMRHKSRFVRFHSWQSFLSQTPVTLLNAFVFILIIVKILQSFTNFFNNEEWNNFHYYNEVFYSLWNVVADHAQEQGGWWIFTKNMLLLLLFACVVNIAYVVCSIIAAVNASQGKLYFFWLFGNWAYTIVYKKKPYEIAANTSTNTEANTRATISKNAIVNSSTSNAQTLLEIGKQALKKAALNEQAKQFVLQNPALYATLKKAADRYIGGEELEEAIITIGTLNTKGFSVTTEYIGESIRNEQEANEATCEFIKLAKVINEHTINSSISLDLSHIGLLVSEELVSHNLQTICKEAAKAGQEVIISMEGSNRVDAVLNIYKNTARECTNLGITLQAYLYRTKDDFADISKLPGSIRIVKGAYDVSPKLAMARGPSLDETYLQYVQVLLSADKQCAIATHDKYIYKEAVKLVEQYKAKHYVFERLLGVRNEGLQEYLDKGYNCRMYVVYGREWYLYLCNRWAEYPLHVFRGLSDIMESS